MTKISVLGDCSIRQRDSEVNVDPIDGNAEPSRTSEYRLLDAVGMLSAT